METFYKAYTKITQNRMHYFVKRYLCFPEYKDVADILEGYGMHTDFSKACAIAGVNNVAIQKQLLAEIEASIPKAKVIELNTSEDISMIKKIAQ